VGDTDLVDAAFTRVFVDELLERVLRDDAGGLRLPVRPADGDIDIDRRCRIDLGKRFAHQPLAFAPATRDGKLHDFVDERKKAGPEWPGPPVFVYRGGDENAPATAKGTFDDRRISRVERKGRAGNSVFGQRRLDVDIRPRAFQ